MMNNKSRVQNLDPLSFKELREKNVERCVAAFHPVDAWSPTDWACAAAGEVGEACNEIKKLRRGEDVSKEKIGKEIADAIIYLDLLAERLGIDAGEAVRNKFNEVSDRKGCDIKFEVGRAISNGQFRADGTVTE